MELSFEEIVSGLHALTNIRTVDKNEYPKNGDFAVVVEGDLEILGTSVTLIAAFDHYFPNHLPQYFLKPYNALGIIPHVDKYGFVCFIKDEGLLLDTEKPLQIIEESLEKVIQLLAGGISGENSHIEFLKEFESYLTFYNDCHEINSIIELSSYVKKVKIALFEEITIAGDNQIDVINFAYKHIGSLRTKKPKVIEGIYIPLREDTLLKPPPFDDFWGIAEIKRLIFDNITQSNKSLLKRMINERIRSPLLVIICVPQLNGIKTVFGLLFNKFKPLHNRSGRHNQRYSNPLKKVDFLFRISPLIINRFDKDFIVPRGGGSSELINKKIALVGCGSVGGHIAIELARSGITDIELFDSDNMAKENIYRHLLGVNSLINQNYKKDLSSEDLVNPKILALKEDIENKLPFTHVNAPSRNKDSIESQLLHNKIDFKKYDLVIVALGNPTIEILINEHFHKTEELPPVIFTWLEAYGIGGHAILSNNKGVNGCLKCLYIDPLNENKPTTNRASFAAPGQVFTKSVSGCGSLFTPYGSLDAIQTAIIATRLAIDVLNGRENDNPIISWKGQSDSFLEAGFSLSDHYNISSDQLYESRYLYKVASCPVCGEKITFRQVDDAV